MIREMPIVGKDHWIWQLKEIHHSGIEPHSWVCGWCGKKLKDEKHALGLTTGVRYCIKCIESGRSARDLEKIDDDDWLRMPGLYYGGTTKKPNSFKVRKLDSEL